MTNLQGKRVLVMGLGRFGGGAGVAQFLVEQGAQVRVTDLADADQLADPVAALSDLPIDWRLGEHRVADFQQADLVVVNPAVKPHGNVFLNAAREAHVPLTSEIRLLIERLPNRGRTIGITGTAGKSTVTAMIGHILDSAPGRRMMSEANRAGIHLGGNLGGSLLNQLSDIHENDWVILELSSFMLDWLRDVGWSPHIAVITNLQPNHLDWHVTYEHYVAAKRVIIASQEPGDYALVGDPQVDWRPPSGVNASHVYGAGPIGLPLPGAHNQFNARLACAAATAAGIAVDYAKALADFPGLPHRLQLVTERDGVRYFNDSKCTTPDAARLAIESFDPATVHVILGGYDKGADLKPLAGFAYSHCKAIYAIGATAASFTADNAVQCATLDRAMREIRGRVESGDVVLLSPACASWDQFDHYEQRGDVFTALAQASADAATP